MSSLKELEKEKTEWKLEEERQQKEHLRGNKAEEVADDYITPTTQSEEEVEAVERSDETTAFGEGTYAYIHDFEKMTESLSEKIKNGERMKEILGATEEFNRLMKQGTCPDGMPDEAVLEALAGEARDKVISACDHFLRDDLMSADPVSERMVKKLKASVIEEAETLEDFIFAYLSMHPPEDKGKGVMLDPSRELETKSKDETGVNLMTNQKHRALRGTEIGDGNVAGDMNFSDIILSVEKGTAGQLTKRDADEYRRSVNAVHRMKGNRYQQQRRFFRVAEELGSGQTVPLEIDGASGAMNEPKSTSYINYYGMAEFSAEEERSFGVTGKRAISLVKSLGFILGIDDWQKMVDAEQLMYEKDTFRGLTLQLKQMQGSVNLEGNVSRAEAELFVKRYEKGRDADALKDLAANLGNQMLFRRLAGALGVDANRLYARMETLFFCIKAYMRTGSIQTVPDKYFA